MIMTEQDTRAITPAMVKRNFAALVDEFVANLQNLSRGDMAKLARGSGNSGQFFRAFYTALPYQLKKHEDALLLVARAFSICKDGYRFSGSFGKTVLAIKNSTGSKSTDRRFMSILDSRFDNGELEHRLIQMVKMAKSKDIGIDWKQLAFDIMDWNRDGKSVQKE
jgi:CRISPR type I-E-associated protein CasB/Cse2